MITNQPLTRNSTQALTTNPCLDLLDAGLLSPANRFLARAGKRIRESMLQLTFQMAGGQGKPPACLGKAIEWLHAGSLVIDDIEDDSLSRRGKPTLHREIGLPLALNAGNWMYFRALEQLLDGSLLPLTQHRLLRQMIVTARRCHEGQTLDLTSRVDRDEPKDFHSIVSEISRLKTGGLVSMAASFGATAMSSPKFLRDALSRFGMNVGIALQMRNDLEELRTLVRDANENVELRCDDLRHARVTWPWAWAVLLTDPSGLQRLIALMDQSRTSRQAMLDLAAQLVHLVSSTGDSMIRSRIEAALGLLGEHVVDTSALHAMRSMLDQIMKPIHEQSIEQSISPSMNRTEERDPDADDH